MSNKLLLLLNFYLLDTIFCLSWTYSPFIALVPIFFIFYAQVLFFFSITASQSKNGGLQPAVFLIDFSVCAKYYPV